MDSMLGLGDGNSLLVCASFIGGGCRSSAGSLAGHAYHGRFAHSALRGPKQTPHLLLTLAFVPSLSGCKAL